MSGMDPFSLLDYIMGHSEQIMSGIPNFGSVSNTLIQNIKPVTITDEILSRLEKDLETKNTLDSIDEQNLNYDVKYHSDIFFNYIFREKSMNLWNRIMVQSNYIAWLNFNKYVSKNKICLKELLELDENIVYKSMLYLDNNINIYNDLKNNLIVFYLIDKLNFEQDNDTIILSCLQPLLKTKEFNTFITNKIIDINKTFNSGMFTLEQEEKVLTQIDQLKLLYIFIKEVDLVRITDEQSHHNYIFKTIESLLDNFYNNLYNRRLTIEKMIELHNEKLNTYISEQLKYSVLNIYPVINKLKKYLDTIGYCIENKITNDILENFFIKSIEKNRYTDCILRTICIFFRYNTSYFNDNIAKFIVDIINTKNNTTNPHIRSGFLEMATNHEEYCEVFNKQLTEASINFFNDVELNKDSNIDMEKIFIRRCVYKYFLKKFDIELLKKIDKNKLKMFMNFIVRDLSQCLENLESLMKQYMECADTSTGYMLQKNTAFINDTIDYIDNSTLILKKFIDSKSIDDHLLSSEILVVFRAVISKAIHIYDDVFIENGSALNEICELIYTTIDFHKPLIKFFEILGDLDEDSLDIVFNDCGVDKELYEKIYVVLLSIDPNLNMVDISSLKKVDDVEYPDEYLDDITYEVLTEPVIVPGTNEQVTTNRSSIVQYIMTDGLNPYTKQPLSLDELDNYNTKFKDRLEKLKQEIEEFKIKANKNKEQ